MIECTGRLFTAATRHKQHNCEYKNKGGYPPENETFQKRSLQRRKYTINMNDKQDKPKQENHTSDKTRHQNHKENTEDTERTKNKTAKDHPSTSPSRQTIQTQSNNKHTAQGKQHLHIRKQMQIHMKQTKAQNRQRNTEGHRPGTVSSDRTSPPTQTQYSTSKTTSAQKRTNGTHTKQTKHKTDKGTQRGTALERSVAKPPLGSLNRFMVHPTSLLAPVCSQVTFNVNKSYPRQVKS